MKFECVCVLFFNHLLRISIILDTERTCLLSEEWYLADPEWQFFCVFSDLLSGLALKLSPASEHLQNKIYRSLLPEGRLEVNVVMLKKHFWE